MEKRVSEIKPEYRAAIFTNMVRAEYALSYTGGALSKIWDGYQHLLKHETKRKFNALQRSIDGYHAYVKSHCVDGDDDNEMLLDCSVTFGQMMSESVKYLENLNARLLLKSGYGHQDLLTKLSVAHILMDTTAFAIGHACKLYPALIGLRTMGGKSPMEYGSCKAPHCSATSFASLHKMLCEFNVEMLRRMGYDGHIEYKFTKGSDEYNIFNNVQTMLADRFCDNKAICALSKGISGKEAVEESRRMTINAKKNEANKNFKNQKI